MTFPELAVVVVLLAILGVLLAIAGELHLDARPAGWHHYRTRITKEAPGRYTWTTAATRTGTIVDGGWARSRGAARRDAHRAHAHLARTWVQSQLARVTAEAINARPTGQPHGPVFAGNRADPDGRGHIAFTDEATRP